MKLMNEVLMKLELSKGFKKSILHFQIIVSLSLLTFYLLSSVLKMDKLTKYINS